MQTTTLSEAHYFRAAGVFVACLVGTFALPLIGLYTNSAFLFFSTQWLFPYEQLVKDGAPRATHFVFSHSAGRALTLFHWGLAGAAFTWCARHVPLRFTVAAALLTVIIVGAAMHMAFALAGVRVELDAP